MDNRQWIPVTQICESHHITTRFFDDLEQYGLVSLRVEQQHRYLNADQLSAVEKILVLHHELGINFEGIETVIHLLQKINTLQQEMLSLRQQLGTSPGMYQQVTEYGDQ